MNVPPYRDSNSGAYLSIYLSIVTGFEAYGEFCLCTFCPTEVLSNSDSYGSEVLGRLGFHGCFEI